MANIIYVGHVATYLKELFANDKKNLYDSFQTKIQEAADDPDSSEGMLEYNKLVFNEYKSGKENRVFGFHNGENFYVCLAAVQHRQGKKKGQPSVYTGMTYDGEEQFDSKYRIKVLKGTELDRMDASRLEAVSKG